MCTDGYRSESSFTARLAKSWSSRSRSRAHRGTRMNFAPKANSAMPPNAGHRHRLVRLARNGHHRTHQHGHRTSRRAEYVQRERVIIEDGEPQLASVLRWLHADAQVLVSPLAVVPRRGEAEDLTDFVVPVPPYRHGLDCMARPVGWLRPTLVPWVSRRAAVPAQAGWPRARCGTAALPYRRTSAAW